MEPKDKLFWCLLLNTIILVIVVILIIIFRNDGSKYFRFGPQEDLIVISVHINTWTRYFCFIGVICPIKIIEVIVNEYAMPVLGFNIYNPDKKEITEFSKNELQFYANAMYMVNGIRYIMLIVITVTQVDLALIVTVISEITSFFMIRVLLNEKTFIKDESEGFQLME